MNINIDEQIKVAEARCASLFLQADEIALANQKKVLDAFRELKISARHFAPSSGYGYDDQSRDTLNALYSRVFGAEDAIVSPLIASGTHALTLTLFGLLRPNDILLSISNKPYDTMHDVINGGNGSLADFGIKYAQIELKDGKIDLNSVAKLTKELSPKVVYIQRSRGYEWRNALSIEDIEEAVKTVRNTGSDAIIVVDNCYGEFVDTKEPTEVGADLAVGSLIKNAGGGLAPTGAYIVGTKSAVEQVAYRFTSPSIGKEVGSYLHSYQYFYQGLFLAPAVVKNAIKGSILAANLFETLNYRVSPQASEYPRDIIRAIQFDCAEQLIAFCQSVQYASPIDSHVTPYAWDMPGYNHQVIMAAGTFVQGASIELSADSPIKEPYIAYLQGGLTYEHAKIALSLCAKNILNANRNK